MISFFRTFIALAFITCCISNCRAQSKDTVIKQIRASFQKINNDHSLKTVKLENEDFLPEPADNGTSLTGYYKKDTIYKMSVWIGVSYCIRQYDYYLQNGKPFFIYETERDFQVSSDGTMDPTKLKLAFEGRYYLDEGKVINIKIKGKKKMEEKPTVASVQSLVGDAKSYAKLLFKRINKAK